MTRRHEILAALLLITAVLSAYSFMLQPSFKTMDDTVSIIENPLVTRPGGLIQIFTTSFFGKQAYYRPLVTLSFRAEFARFKYKLVGTGYYLDNIFLHILSSLVVWIIFALILGRGWPAWAAALVFAIHPVHWEAVSNIPGRAILLNGFFDFAALAAFIRAGQLASASRAAPTIWKRRGYYGLSLICFGLALLSKESAAMLPFVLFAYQFMLAGDSGNHGDQRSGAARNDPAASSRPSTNAQETTTAGKLLPVIPYIAMVFVYIIWRKYLGITEVFTWRNGSEAALGFLTFLRGTLTYIRLLILPLDLHFDRSLPLLSGYWNQDVMLVIAMFASFGLALWHWRQRIPRPVWFCLLWSAFSLAPVSQLWFTVGVMPGAISLAEHFLYTASAGIIAAAVVGLAALSRSPRVRQTISPGMMTAAFVGIVTFYAITTVQMNFYAQSEMVMFERSLRFSPHNTRIRAALARIYAGLGNYTLAEAHYHQAVITEPGNPRYRIGWGKALVDTGNIWQGIEAYHAVTAPGEELAPLLNGNLAAAYDLFIEQQLRQLWQHPDDPQAHYRLGVVHSIKGEPQKARRHFMTAALNDPQMAPAWFNLASVCDALDDWPCAAASYRRFLEIAMIDEEGAGGESDPRVRQSAARLPEMERKLRANKGQSSYNIQQ